MDHRSVEPPEEMPLLSNLKQFSFCGPRRGGGAAEAGSVEEGDNLVFPFPERERRRGLLGFLMMAVIAALP